MDERKKEMKELKKKLWEWGRAMERFVWKEEEIKKIQMFYEMQREIWEKRAGGKNNKELEQIQKEYQEEVGKLRIEMVEILREKRRMDEMIRRLEREEQTFLKHRFEKGYGFDYISVKMHLSRATLFRMQNKALEELLEIEKLRLS